MYKFQQNFRNVAQFKETYIINTTDTQRRHISEHNKTEFFEQCEIRLQNYNIINKKVNFCINHLPTNNTSTPSHSINFEKSHNSCNLSAAYIYIF